MRFGIIGPRDFNGAVYINQSYIDEILDEYNLDYEVSEVISGGGKGVEHLVKTWAETNKLAYRTILPNIKVHGHEAFIFRNQSILRESDILILFWDACNHSTIKIVPDAILNKKHVHIIPML